MNTLFILLFLSLSAHSSILQKVRSTPEASESQAFFVEKDSAHYQKNTNLFDQPRRDFAFGTFVLKNRNSSYASIQAHLKALGEQFRNSDKFLKTKGMSFNELSGEVRHLTVFVIDGFTVKPDSKYFGELDKLFAQLQTLEWKLRDGYSFSKDFLSVEKVEKEKVLVKETFTESFFCQKGMCAYRGYGPIYRN